MRLRLVAGCLLLVCACKSPQDQAAADAAIGRAPDRSLCTADTDCLVVGSLCACRSPQCSIIPNFQPQTGDPDGRCVGRLTRLVVRMPIRADGGWVLEGHPRQTWFPTQQAALEDPWRVEQDDRLEREIESLKGSLDAGL